MIRLHCTKKLLAKLPLREDGQLKSKKSTPYAVNDAPESLLNGWHANLLLLQRRQCVLFVHDTTRFQVFVPVLKKADFAELDYWFADGFMNTLLKMGADDDLMQRAHAALEPLICDNDCNRSVQGSLNQMGQEIGFHIDYEGLSVADIAGYRIGAWLADRPCTAKGVKECIWPIEAMHELLKKQGGRDE
ncbi:MAG: hypothetical protein JAY60_21025 [Candidatus Thiodiazotropha weberae]|nr:hypothetical protein [Candidatus Thiodiazotropha weberae]